MREHSHADAAPSPALWSRSVLTVQSQVQCCLALTLRFKHWLQLQSIAGRRYEVWCSNQCTLSMAELFSFICSISCLQRSWEAMQICHSMKCYMIFGLCGLVTHKIISQSIILFQATNVFLGLGLRPPGPISGFAISIWDLPFRLFIFWQLKVRLPMLPMRCYNLPLVKIWALAPSPGLCTI